MALFLVPFNGLKEEPLKDVSGLEFREDEKKEARLAASLTDAGIYALTKLTTKGVLVSGTEFEARAVGNVMAGGLYADNTNAAPKLRQDFGAAVVPFSARNARRPSIMGMQLAA